MLLFCYAFRDHIVTPGRRIIIMVDSSFFINIKLSEKNI